MRLVVENNDKSAVFSEQKCKKVWCEIDKIPRGEVIAYSQIAKNIGHPKAARAVANA